MTELLTQPAPTFQYDAACRLLNSANRDYWTAVIADELINSREPLNERVETILERLGDDGWLALCEFPSE